MMQSHTRFRAQTQDSRGQWKDANRIRVGDTLEVLDVTGPFSYVKILGMSTLAFICPSTGRPRS